MNRLSWITFTALVAAALPASSVWADTLRVPSQYPNIRAAITAAQNDDVVLIADGTYTGGDNRNLDFLGKSITVRSENGAQNCIIDCENSGRAFIFRNDESRQSIVSGLTLRRGRAGSPGGGAILCSRAASPTIENCIIDENQGTTKGGGIYSEFGRPRINNCIFMRNAAVGGGSGGAIHCSSATITNCTITNNTTDAGGAGGGLYLTGPSFVSNCIIASNSSSETGGGIACFQANPLILNCTLRNNSALRGGAIHIIRGNTVVRNCLIIENIASSNGGGIYAIQAATRIQSCTFSANNGGGSGAVFCHNLCETLIVNSILWHDVGGRGPEITAQEHSDITVAYSDVEGGPSNVHLTNGSTLKWRDGNLDVDPAFIDVMTGDYHLQRKSPCVDTGDPVCIPGTHDPDIDHEYRIWNGRIDMGADEFASIPVIPGDLNCDFAFNGGDIDPFFLALVDPMGYESAFPCCVSSFADMNADGAVNGADIDPFFACLGGGVCP